MNKICEYFMETIFELSRVLMQFLLQIEVKWQADKKIQFDKRM